MHPITGLLTALGALTVLYIGGWARAFMAASRVPANQQSPATDTRPPSLLHIALGAVTNFFDALGIGSFATTTAVFRLKRMVPDRIIPGTLNAGHTLPTVAQEIKEHLGVLPETLERMARRQPFDIRYVDRLRWTPEEVEHAEARSAVWMRAVGPLGDDPLVHTCALTYASDMTLLDAVRIPVEALWGRRGFDMASLDHAMWFHRPFRTDEWFLYDQESPIATGGRGLARGRIYDREGRLLVSVVQEGLFRKLQA